MTDEDIAESCGHGTIAELAKELHHRVCVLEAAAAKAISAAVVSAEAKIDAALTHPKTN